MEHQENSVPSLSELWTTLQEQHVRMTAQEAEISTLKAKISIQQTEVSSSQRMQEETSPVNHERRRISRAALLKTAAASMAGIATVALTGVHEASAAPATTTDTNFVATGTGNAAIPGFDATAPNQWDDGVSADGIVSGITGTSTNGYGVRGTSTNNDGVVGIAMSNNAVAGVRGIAQATAYGGWFASGSAQLHIEPAGVAGHPTYGNFLKGDIFVDTNGTIWVCITSGNPGTWRRILVHS